MDSSIEESMTYILAVCETGWYPGPDMTWEQVDEAQVDY